jgi:hypothetical protein
MVSLANLAKYEGYYDYWQQTRHRYSLKSSTGNDSLQCLQLFFNPSLALGAMLQWVREAIRVLPVPTGTIIRFNCLTGLRPVEAVESVRLIKESSRATSQYYKPERQCLEHFRFPKYFCDTQRRHTSASSRRSSFRGLALWAVKPLPTWNAIRLACNRRSLSMHMRYCRKLHGSWLHQHGRCSR